LQKSKEEGERERERAGFLPPETSWKGLFSSIFAGDIVPPSLPVLGVLIPVIERPHKE